MGLKSDDIVSNITVADIRLAARNLDSVALRTPVQPFRALSDLVDTPVVLKLENLQRTGSFKIRGAYNRIAHLTSQQRAAGVVAASAGNHAQGVALAAGLLGTHAVVYMPVDAPLPKVAATRGYGADVRMVGNTVDESLAAAQDDAARSGRTFIHPFDHGHVVAGQGTIALEILEQVPDVGTVVVPLGGGGLAAGIAIALDALAPHVKVVAVQAKTAAAFPPSLRAGHPVSTPVGPTMADGIAVGTPGAVTLDIISRLGVDVRTVSEEWIARALLAVAERAKSMVEPAGVVGLAEVMEAGCPGGIDQFDRGIPGTSIAQAGMPGPVVCVLSGGNIDPLLLMRVIQRGMVAAGRYLQIRVRVSDKPGSLAQLVGTVSQAGGNIVDVQHSRLDMQLAIYDAMVTLEIETKGHEHCAAIIDAVSQAGFEHLSPRGLAPREG